MNEKNYSQKASLLVLAALTFSAESALAERADEVTAPVAAPKSAEQSVGPVKTDAKANLQPLTSVAPGKPNISKMVLAAQVKANARARFVSAGRRQEVAAGLAH